MTFYRRTMDSKGVFYKVAGIFGENHRSRIFILEHFVITVGLASIWYLNLGNFLAQTFLGAFVLAGSCYYTGFYYMAIFAKTYNADLEELDAARKEAGGENKRD